MDLVSVNPAVLTFKVQAFTYRKVIDLNEKSKSIETLDSKAFLSQFSGSKS